MNRYKNKGDILGYVLCDSDSSPEKELSDNALFWSVDEAKKWIDENDPNKEVEYKIYSVDIHCVYITEDDTTAKLKGEGK